MKALIILGGFVVFVIALMFLPPILAKILDPIAIRRIRAYCEECGLQDIDVKVWPNHYGVKFSKNGAKHYAKCRVVWRHINWIGRRPEEC